LIAQRSGRGDRAMASSDRDRLRSLAGCFLLWGLAWRGVAFLAPSAQHASRSASPSLEEAGVRDHLSSVAALPEALPVWSRRCALAGGAALLVASRRKVMPSSSRSGSSGLSRAARLARAAFRWSGPEGPLVLISSAVIGVSTGCAVVLFEFVIKSLEAFREELPAPIIAPILGALLLAGIFTAFGGKEGLSGTDVKSLKGYAAEDAEPPENWPLRAAGNAMCAAVTLGLGNSLGPEAPAATVGANVAFGLGKAFAIFGEPAKAAPDEEASADKPRGPSPGAEDRKVIEKAMDGSKVVANLPGKELDKLLPFFQEVKVAAGENLMTLGDEVADDEPGLFVTKSGVLDVWVPGEDGTEKKVFSYQAEGEIIGELAVLFRAPRAATVKASKDAVLWSVDRRSFEACGGRSEGSAAKINQNPDGLLASGAAAGVAAGFNAPIAGIFFAAEVVRPSNDNQLDITTRLLAAALSAAVVQTAFPGGPAIQATGFAWSGGNTELIFFLLLGLLTGVVSYGFKKVLATSRSAASWLGEQGLSATFLPLAGALLTVAVSVACEDRVQFDGFGAVNEVLKDASQPLKEAASNLSLAPLLQERGSVGMFGAATLLVIMVLKIITTTFSAATGLVGGTFAPSIYMGACLGGALGRILEGSIFAHSVPATYIVVGMASMLAANCSVPITSVVLAVELAGGASYEATLPLISGIGVALYVSAVLLPALLDGLDRKAALQRLSQESSADTGM